MNTTEYMIRTAEPADFPEIDKLCLEAYEQFADSVGPAHWEEMRKFLSRTSELLTLGEPIVAENEEGLLGLVLYLPPGKSDGKSIPVAWASLRLLAVSPSSRGRGIGRKLTQECIDRARKDGATAIGLTTSEMMTVARPMYERMCFARDTEVGTRHGKTEIRYVLNFEDYDRA